MPAYLAESGGLENGSLDSPGASPGTPGIGKRDVSFSQVVKRAISFLDAIDDRGSPMHDARKSAQSPHTAIAA